MVNKQASKKGKKKTHEKILPELISAALVQDTTAVQSMSFTIAKSIKKDDPDLANLITDVVSNFSVSKNPMRAMGVSPLPTDVESYSEIATMSLPDSSTQEPILGDQTRNEINSFIKEWNNKNLLLRKNIKPSTSMLLVGGPGTGKTMSAKYVASKLDLNLLTLDLSISMSSLLGKTGQNIKKIFNYARKNPCVLLLDEFDAIAKRRDDPTDLGEIKRVVNVLLLELENWPTSSVVIATSNHPELLDRAVWRRFDKVVEVANPGINERLQIIKNSIESYSYSLNENDLRLIEIAAVILEDKNASDLTRFSERVVRKMILDKVGFEPAFMSELDILFGDKKKLRGLFCVEMKKAYGKGVTIRQLAEMTGLSVAGVQHHLKGLS